ncbi:hypothetical protein E2C01_096496 [Portunus trituberculatus]|uniref:Uncharacterized protein n=1 Tax=Portunus trituberculatus TaxID=210409 RepID=A0A5B7K258_PORTR|nr:hypothetical protein [Portunus trituberculatus]
MFVFLPPRQEVWSGRRKSRSLSTVCLRRSFVIRTPTAQRSSRSSQSCVALS